MDISAPPLVNGKALNMFAGQRVRIVVQVQHNEGGVVVAQSTDGHQLSIRGSGGAPDPQHHMEVTGIVENSYSISSESWKESAESFDMDTSAPTPFVNGETLKMFVGQKVRTVVQVHQSEDGLLTWQSTDGHRLTIRGAPVAPEPPRCLEVIGIAHSDQSIHAESCMDFEMDCLVPLPFVNGETLKMFLGRRVRTVIKVQRNESGLLVCQSTDGHQLTIRDAPTASEPPYYLELIGIADSNQSIRTESFTVLGVNFVDVDYDAARNLEDITVFCSMYYKMFNQKPDLVYTLYAKGCILNWPNSEGGMLTINTVQAARNMFLMKSALWKDLVLRTICVQEVGSGSFLAVVSGRFTKLDKRICKFSQTFVLSKMDCEYRIRNDVLTIQGLQEEVCIIYDENMKKHCAIDSERPARISVIIDKFEAEGLLQRCMVEAPPEVKDSEILAVHTMKQLEFIKNLPSSTRESGKKYKDCFESINISSSSGTQSSVLLAAGGVLRGSRLVWTSKCDHAFAVVRPPGHHAVAAKSDGFCFLNNVAIAVRDLLTNHGARKVLVVDFDVHHGDGTQDIFFSDDRVMFFSSHKEKLEFPASRKQAEHIGIGRGVGYNINLCLPDEFGDHDVLAGFQYLLLPAAKAFVPDIIVVSAGFDAAMGDTVGGCNVTPAGFATMIDELKRIPTKRGLVLALEGGYHLKSLADSAAACLKVLLGDRGAVLSCDGLCPYKETWDGIIESRRLLSPVWPVLGSAIPQNVLGNHQPLPLPAAGQEQQEGTKPRRNPRRGVRGASSGKDPGK